MPFKPEKREYRNIMQVYPDTEQKRLNTEYYIEGYAATWEPYTLMEIDGIKYNEKIDRNAFASADMSDVIMQYNHDGKVFARNTNGTLIVEPDDKGFFIAADLSKSNGAKELHGEIKEGLITKMSWAFTVDDEEYDRSTRTRIIKRVKKVYDVSAVSIPANDGTEISARSYVNGVIDVEKQELLQLEKEREIFKFRRKK